MNKVLSGAKTVGFKASDLFEIKKGKRLTKADMLPGDINFIGSTSANNGVTAKIGNTAHLHPGGTITVSYNGSVGEVFLQEEPFWASDDVNVWYPRFEYDARTVLYIMTVIKKCRGKYSYTAKWTIDKMRSEELKLPVVESFDPEHIYTIDDIDYGYMQERIAELEQERIAELEQERIAELDAYLMATGLDDYELTEEDKSVLSLPPKREADEARPLEAAREDGQVRFESFALGSLLSSSTGDVDLQQRDINGKGEFLVNSGVNNHGIKGRTDRAAKVFPPNTITVDFWGNAYYRDFAYKMATHNHVFSLSGDVIKNREVGLYIVGQLSRLPRLFSYNNMATWNKLKILKIGLPVTPSGDIDFDYMERYIRAVEKLAIADVARYRDREISEAKRICGRVSS